MALGEASPFTISGGISLSSGVPARMCRVALLVTLVSLVRVSTQAPPRLSSCRNIYKAKDINEFYPFQGCKYYDVLFGQNIGSVGPKGYDNPSAVRIHGIQYPISSSTQLLYNNTKTLSALGSNPPIT